MMENKQTMKTTIKLICLSILLLSCLKEKDSLPKNTNDILDISFSKDTIYLGIDSNILFEFCVNEKYTDKSINLKLEGGTIDNQSVIENLKFNGETCISKIFTVGQKTGIFPITATFNEANKYVFSKNITILPPSSSQTLSMSIEKNEFMINRGEEIPIQITLDNKYSNRKVKIFNQNTGVQLVGYASIEPSINIPISGFEGILKVSPSSNISNHILKICTEDNQHCVEQLIKLSKDHVDSVLNIQNISANEILANGVDEFDLKIDLNNLSSKQILVKSNSGTFITGQKEMNINMINSSQIIKLKTSNTASIIKVDIETIGDTKYEKTLYLTPIISNAQTIETHPLSWSIDSSETTAALIIEGKLTCETGKVTEGREISAIAYQIDNGNIQHFGNFGFSPMANSDLNGKFSLTYNHSPYANKSLPLIFEIKAPSNNGIFITDTISIQIN